MKKVKRENQLGMNPSTASGRLVKDLLFKFVGESGHTCFRCGREMTRDDFSIEHKSPWLDSDDPVKLFFDLDNIAFSHKSCNYSQGGKSNRFVETEDQRRARLASYTKGSRDRMPIEERQRVRREKYLRTGT